ncbi:MAG: DUF6445 family protein [Gammaproteobacteria bacterium]|nr:DUF6445 family protein [Gammaproteobacteria bacterium]
MVDPSPFRINPNAEVRLHEIADGRNCAIVDDVLENPESLVDFAVSHANQFAWLPVPPGPRLIVGEDALQDLQRFIRSELSRHFPIHRTGLMLKACLSNVTLAPEKLSYLQRLCHIDRRASPTRRIYAGLIYLFRNPDLGGTAFYRWKRPDVIAEAERLFQDDPAAAWTYLDEASEIFREPPQYMTGSNDIAELLTVVPARFNRLVFYDGEAPHSGHITNPDLLSDDLSKGRLTLNFFANVHPR